MEVTDVDDKAVTLSWQKPRDEGGARLQGYVVEVRSPSDRSWRPATERPIKDTEFTVPDLNNGEKYEFRVRAKNEAGLGEPSDVTKPVLVKPKYSTDFGFALLSLIELIEISLIREYRNFTESKKVFIIKIKENEIIISNIYIYMSAILF